MRPPEPDAIVSQLVRSSKVLRSLPTAALRDLLAAAEERAFAAGEALVVQGEPGDGLLILLEGTAEAWLRRPTGEDYQLGRFAIGDVVGEMALVTREPRSASVIADTPVRALFVHTDAFDQLASRHLELSTVLTRLVADRLGRSTHDGFGGKRVEGYQILRCVGRGGMSVVYEARDESTGELVALKMMSYRLIYDARALARFRQEAELVQGLDHENIARLKRLFPAYHTYFLVMELCEGEDLDRLVRRRGPLPEAAVRPVLGQLARALQHVHARGLVHRDLKPANVMVTRGGLIKLTDFGVAIPIVSDDSQTRIIDQSLMGTPAFMAPEQLSGAQVDSRADVYALGCLAYELLTGRHLFPATNLFELVQQKVGLRLPAAGDIGAGISSELHALLESALQVDPATRLASLDTILAWAAPIPLPPDPGPHASDPPPTTDDLGAEPRIDDLRETLPP